MSLEIKSTSWNLNSQLVIMNLKLVDLNWTLWIHQTELVDLNSRISTRAFKLSSHN